MYIHELAALGAASCWALSSLLSAKPSRELGAIRLSAWRALFVCLMLAGYVTVRQLWGTLHPAELWPVLLSGLIGIGIGDAVLFMSMNRLGPRRCGILFALNAPLAALLGWLFLDESLSLPAVGGIVLCMAGVLLAIVFGKRRSQLHHWESIKGPLWIGVLLGLLAALTQAVGSLLARPVLEAGTDPVAVTMLRTGTGAACLFLFAKLFPRSASGAPFTPSLIGWVMLSGIVAVAIGVSLLMFALAGGKVGIISTLSATSPVMILPLIWLRTREMPAPGAWLGAALVVAGCTLIFLR